jgi:MFS family permease
MARRAEAVPGPAPGESTAAQLGALLLAVAFAFLGNGLLGTVTGLRASAEGMPSEAIGVIMSAFFLGFIGGSLMAPRLIQRVGHIRAFAALASLASAGSLALAIVVSVPAWIALRLALGACFSGMVIVVESWLNAGVPSARRGRLLALYGMVLYAAWGASQLLILAAPVEGFVLFCLVSILFSVALVPVTLTRAGAPGVVLAERARFGRLVEVSPVAVFGALALGLGMGAFWGMAPSWGAGAGLSEPELSAFLASVLVGALVLQWPLGWLSDVLDRRLVIAAATGGAGLAGAALAIAGEGGGWALPALGFLLGGLAMPSYSLCVAHANDRIEPGEIVAVSSALVLVYGAGSAAGPLLAGLLMDAAGGQALFPFVAGWLLACAVHAGARALLTRATPEAEKFDYVPVPQTSHAALPMHRHGTGTPDRARAPR